MGYRPLPLPPVRVPLPPNYRPGYDADGVPVLISPHTGEPYDPSWVTQLVHGSSNIQPWNTSEFEIERMKDNWIDVPFWFAWICWTMLCAVVITIPLAVFINLDWMDAATSLFIIVPVASLFITLEESMRHKRVLAQRSIVQDVADYRIELEKAVDSMELYD